LSWPLNLERAAGVGVEQLRDGALALIEVRLEPDRFGDFAPYLSESMPGFSAKIFFSIAFTAACACSSSMSLT
jgi:hypothetical protein